MALQLPAGHLQARYTVLYPGLDGLGANRGVDLAEITVKWFVYLLLRIKLYTNLPCPLVYPNVGAWCPSGEREGLSSSTALHGPPVSARERQILGLGARSRPTHWLSPKALRNNQPQRPGSTKKSHHQQHTKNSTVLVYERNTKPVRTVMI